jgi:hypothetical protein
VAVSRPVELGPGMASGRIATRASLLSLSRGVTLSVLHSLEIGVFQRMDDLNQYIFQGDFAR